MTRGSHTHTLGDPVFAAVSGSGKYAVKFAASVAGIQAMTRGSRMRGARVYVCPNPAWHQIDIVGATQADIQLLAEAHDEQAIAQQIREIEEKYRARHD